MTQAGPTILFLVTEDWYFVSHRLRLAEAAVAAGFRVVVACRVQRHGEQIRAVGCELHALGWQRSGNSLASHWRALQEIALLYREVRPAIVHHIALKAIVFGGIAAWWSRIPCIVSAVSGLGFVFVSQSWGARARRPFVRIWLAWALRRGQKHRVIVQNRDDRNAMLRWRLAPAERIVLIRGAGVPTDVFYPGQADGGPPVVILVARLLWDKGIAAFVQAATSLKGMGVEARFRLVGAPDVDNPASVPQWQIDEWRGSGVVEYLGHREDVPMLLQGASVFCLPSYGEGLPRSLLEAAACGLALVATDVPGCREVVRHRETGLLVPVGDQQALEAALAELLADGELRARLSAAARALVEREFALPRVIEETLAVYRELLR